MLSANCIQHNGLLDRISVVFSGLCILHCLALPVFLLIVPLTGGLIASDTHFHEAMLLVIGPVSLLAFYAGFRKHHSTRVLLLGMIGLVLLVIAATVAHDAPGALAETAFSVAGSVALIGAHWTNLKLSRQSPPAG